MFCWHKWARWSEAIKDYDGSIHQARSCEHCGKTLLRRIVSIYRAQVQAEEINNALGRSHEHN